MIRLLLLILLFFLGYTLVQALLRPTSRRPGPPPAKRPEGEDMVQDPQCGTFLPRGDALIATVRGRQHYFCSRECRDAYTKSS